MIWWLLKSTKVVTECDHGWYELQWKILQRDFFEVRFLLLTLERFLICWHSHFNVDTVNKSAKFIILNSNFSISVDLSIKTTQWTHRWHENERYHCHPPPPASHPHVANCNVKKNVVANVEGAALKKRILIKKVPNLLYDKMAMAPYHQHPLQPLLPLPLLPLLPLPHQLLPNQRHLTHRHDSKRSYPNNKLNLNLNLHIHIFLWQQATQISGGKL